MAEYPYQLQVRGHRTRRSGGDRNRPRRDPPPSAAAVVLMPEGTDPGTLYDRARWLVDICKRERFRYGPRLHIDIYGNRRGV